MTPIKNNSYEITRIDHVWISMSDGARLAATIWIPEDANDYPVPAILEYLPYRKDDSTALRDSLRHPYFAEHGYASIRVDMRGCGNSDGYLPDEYLKQEQDDALEIFDWIKQQTWSTGKVGMIGKSWGGFNGLQIAERQHPALQAVITICSTDDRFKDDVHYRGGNILASDMLSWASTMFAYSARPQDPEVVGESWWENWMERLNTTPYAEEWLSHQTRDDYWKHGSVCENYQAVDIPVFAVSGWMDGYTDAVFRLVENLPHAKGLIGPWNHEFPEVAGPSPAIGFLQECLRFWDQHLKGIETGVDQDPKLISWVQDSMPPNVSFEERPGKWVADTTWPSEHVQPKHLWLDDSMLKTSPAHTTKNMTVTGMQEHGFYSGLYCPFGDPGDAPADQRLENGKCVVFTTEPLTEGIEMLGHPMFDMAFKANEKNALVNVRLCDKAPTGESTLISWGMLNLNHLVDHEHPEDLVPGQTYQARIQLDSLGQTVPEGHQLELAVSPTSWPQAWPSPKPVTLEILASENTKLSLPVRAPQSEQDDAVWFQAPETSPMLEHEVLREGKTTRKVTHEMVSGQWQQENYSDGGDVLLVNNKIRFGNVTRNVFTIETDNPLAAKAESHIDLTMGRDGWDIKLETHSTMTSDEDNFYLENTMIAYYNEEQCFDKTWEKTIPRHYQ